MTFLGDKLGDVKTMGLVHECLVNIAELLGTKYIALQVIKSGTSAKAINVIKESCNCLVALIDEYGPVGMPFKEMIDFGKVAVDHKDVKVRGAAQILFKTLFQHVGEPIRNFMNDIKESTLKVIEEEFKKTTPFKAGEFEAKRKVVGAADAPGADAGKKGGKADAGIASLLDDAIPRVDVSKAFNQKMIALFKHADWKVRK